jgi:N-methylhydantoinase A
VPVPAGRPDAAWLATLTKNFEDVYRTYYRHVPEGLPMEAVTWRVRAQSPAPSLPPARAPRAAHPSPKAERRIWIAAESAFRTVPVWDRYTLPPGWRGAGPVVVEETESTTVVSLAFDVRVDDDLNLVLSRRSA